MADSSEPNATLDADPKTAADSAKPTTAAPAKAASDAASAQTTSPPDDDLQALIEKVKTTITNSLEEKDFDKQLRKHIKKIKGWQDWSEHAKSAFAHMWAAQLLHNKAVDIKKASEMDFTPVTGDSYKKLVRSLTHRVRF